MDRERNDVFVEQSFSPEKIRPYFAVINRETKETTIVNVTVPYESGTEAFQKARSENEQKYESLLV